MNKKKSQKHCLSKKNIDADDPLLFHVLLLYLLKPVKEVNVLTHTLNPTGHAHYIFSNIQMLNPNIKPHRTLSPISKCFLILCNQENINTCASTENRNISFYEYKYY